MLGLLLLFCLVAFVYSSAGFGGGSSYTAILAWGGEGQETIRLLSLSCNLVVVAIGGWASFRNGRVKGNLLGPLLCFSIPMTWFGAELEINRESFLLILGGALLVAGLILLLEPAKRGDVCREQRLSWGVLLPLGGGLGFLAGVTGIGGGIYLVPVLHLLRAAPEKDLAAVGTWFILVNSSVGLMVLAAQGSSGQVDWAFPFSVAAGGTCGSLLLQKKLPVRLLRRWTGGLVFIIAVRLLWQ